MARHSHSGEPGPNAGAVIDRSRVRVLLCDPEPSSSQEALLLLSRCSYQVSSVKSARQVIDSLNAQGEDIDVILVEVDLPYAKGFKMLKYIARNKDLRRIPIIMMSSQDEVSVVVKCLRLGAADFLVKPLRTNELLNLWTHVWRRRRMLGLPDKEFFTNELELVLSDPSDANTSSTIMLSDDSEDKLTVKETQEACMSTHLDKQPDVCAARPLQKGSLEDLPVTSADADLPVSMEGIFSSPLKTDLKVAESSAFLAYVKPSIPSANLSHTSVERNAVQPCTKWLVRAEQNQEGSCMDDRDQEVSLMQEELRGNKNLDAGSSLPMLALPFFYPGGMEQAMLALSSQSFHESQTSMQAPGSSTPVPLLNAYSQCQQAPGMPSFPFGPIMMAHVGWQPAPISWPMTAPSSSALEEKGNPSDRRAAALMKFRRKRKERCFDKKIRYINRKRLAETRPRFRGQFVRHLNNEDAGLVDVVSVGDENTEDEEEDPTSRELESVSSPE